MKNSIQQKITGSLDAMYIGMIFFLIWMVFKDVVDFAFLGYDDNKYVTQNYIVQSGLTIRGLKWAFSNIYFHHWIPLTWLSHMIDCQLYGLNPGLHHVTNVLLHALNSICLYWTLVSLTHDKNKSFAVSCLFAIHPLHVESVVWIASRKDLLSTFFFIMAIRTYIWYVQWPEIRRYLLVLSLFVLALMSKPMVIVLPVVLLLLDYWPLNRIHYFRSAIDWRRLKFILIEKIPFMICSLGFSAATYWFHLLEHKTMPVDYYPYRLRIANAFYAYTRYLIKTFLPFNLAAHYPHPMNTIPASNIIVSVFMILTLLIVFIYFKKKMPFLLVGFLWYLTAFFPMIQIFQMGKQFVADRWTYIPLIGVFIALTWSMGSFMEKFRRIRTFTRIVFAGIIAVLVFVSHSYALYWRDTRSIFTYTLSVTGGDYVAYNNLGLILMNEGDLVKAEEHFRSAIRMSPIDGGSYSNLGVLYYKKGDFNTAQMYFEQAISIDPSDADAIFNLATVLEKFQKQNDAMLLYQKSIQINPMMLNARNNLGNILMENGNDREAVFQFRTILDMHPNDWYALTNLGHIYFKKGHMSEARVLYKKALLNSTKQASLYYSLALLEMRCKNTSEAVRYFKQTLMYQPSNKKAHNNLGVLFASLGQSNKAKYHFHEALRIDDTYEEARKNLEVISNHKQVSDVSL